MKKKLTFIFMVFIAFGLTSGEVYADAQDEFTLEEITVTAQKREENLQKVPISMDVISSEEIKELGQTDLSEILGSLSNAMVSRSGDTISITIRGVGNMSSPGQPGVSMNIDGVTSNRQDSGTGLYDLERVEVLYGPQSTLYATNSPGGVVNIVTASPKLDNYEGSGTLQYGNYNYLRMAGTMNAPLGDKVAVRTAFSTIAHDGYVSNGGDTEDSKSARIKVLYKPSDKISAEITGEYLKQNGISTSVTGFIDESDTDDPWVSTADLGANNQRRKKLYGTINISVPYADVTLTPSVNKISGYAETVQSLGPRDAPTGYETMKNIKDSYEKGMEVRLTSPDDFFFSWIAGYIYYDSKSGNNRMSNDYEDTGIGEFMVSNTVEKIKTLYANVTYPVTDQFRLTAGIRKNDNDYYYETDQNMANTDDDGNITYTFESKVQTTESPSKPDTKFGMEYDISDSVMLYGSYGSSYRIIQRYRSLGDPETLHAYTVGAKSQLFGNKLQLNGSAYYYDYKNYLAMSQMTVWLADSDDDLVIDSDETADDSGASQQGDGRMMGFDISASAIISANDKLDLSVSYLNSEWTDLVFAWDYDYTYELIDGEVVRTELIDDDFEGKSMVNSPPWTISVTYNHNFNLWNGGVLSARLETRYQSHYRMSWQDSNDPYDYQESFFKEDLSAIYANPDGKWTLTGYVKNITNYAAKKSFSGSSTSYTLNISDPRTYGAILSVKF